MKQESKVLRHCEACGIVGHFGKGEWENHLKRAKHVRVAAKGSPIKGTGPDPARTCSPAPGTQ